MILVNEPWTESDPTTNWDFYYIGGWTSWITWAIVDAQYISAPTSIWFGDPKWGVYALSKHADAQDLKAGRITCWVRSQIAGVGGPRYFIGVKGPDSEGIALVPNFANNVWYRTRFTWYQEGGQTVVKRELWKNDAWVYQDTNYYDPMTGDTNRVGIGSFNQAIGYMRYYDDTIIESIGVPSVTTDPATDITTISATLNGTLDDDGGEACTCGFEWGLTTDYGETTSTESKTEGQTFAQAISGLSPGTLYHFRAKATNSWGTVYGSDLTFTTLGDVYPSQATTRVSSLTHRWVPGSYTLEMVLGGLTSDFGLAIPSGKPTPTLPTLPSCQPDEVLSWSFERGWFCLPKADIPPGKY